MKGSERKTKAKKLIINLKNMKGRDKMPELKDLFKDGALTYEQLQAACSDAKIQLGDISDYTPKSQYDELQAKLTERENDIGELNKKLEAAKEADEKAATLKSELEALQAKYQKEADDFKANLNKQAYEFAVKEFANSKKFSSEAAKRDFISSLNNKKLTLENGKILGAEDFLTVYSATNADAFVSGETSKKTATGSTMPSGNNTITKEQFARMSYKQRAELFNTDRELYNSLK